jgi:hypothetical protein
LRVFAKSVFVSLIGVCLAYSYCCLGAFSVFVSLFSVFVSLFACV